MKAYLKPIAKLNACPEALDWAQDYGSLKEAWQNCKRGDWMLWLIGKTIIGVADRKPLALAACECARLALPYVSKGEERPLKAIETAEAWARGKATIKKVTMAANAAYVAANVADDAAYAAGAAAGAAGAASAAYAAAYAARAAAYAAHAAAGAASATYVVAYSAADATYAATNATYVAANVAACAASAATLSQCANIMRKHYPVPPFIQKS